MKKRSIQQYAKALYTILQETNKKEVSKVIHAFVELLARDRVLSRSNDIIEAFITYTKKQEGVVSLTITSAYTLDAGVVKKITALFGKAVEVQTQENPLLLGGVVLRTEDTILDASVQTQITRLKKHLAL
jgi:F-type H+-transporting ATPase subunit delta